MSNLIVCPTCRFYFTPQRIKIHQKICNVFFKITGNKNNNQYISRLTTGQRNYILQFYQNNLYQKKAITDGSVNKNNLYQKKAITDSSVNQNNLYQKKAITDGSVNQNKYIYKSPYKNNTTVPYQSNYQDIYSQRQIALYNSRKNTQSSKKTITYYTGNTTTSNSAISNSATSNAMTSNSATSNAVSRNVMNSNAGAGSDRNWNLISKIKNFFQPSPSLSPSTSYISEDNTSKNSVPMSLIPISINFQYLIQDKNIALVGPSKSILGRNLGSYIDNTDLVVRLNKSLPIPQKRFDDIGSRTDIIYNSLNTSDYPGENRIEPQFFLNNGVKYVCCPYPLIHPFKNDIMNFMINNKGLVPFRYIDLGLYQKMENILKTRPYTGTCAILDLLKFNINKLFITGLDFYATSYYSEYRKIDKNDVLKKRKNNIHDADPQIELLRNLTLNDPRIIPDSVLENILFKPYRHILKLNPKNVFTKFDLHYFETVEKANLYFLGNAVSLKTWDKIHSNRGVYDLIICNINNQFLKNTGNVNIIIDNFKKDIDDLQFQKGCGIMINIFDKNSKKYLEKWKSIGCDVIKFNTQYNNEMNNHLRKVKIESCSIDLYILLSLVLLMKNHRIYVSGLDFSQRRSENLFYKFLLREKMIDTINY